MHVATPPPTLYDLYVFINRYSEHSEQEQKWEGAWEGRGKAKRGGKTKGGQRNLLEVQVKGMGLSHICEKHDSYTKEKLLHLLKKRDDNELQNNYWN